MSEFADIIAGLADTTSSLMGPDEGVTYVSTATNTTWKNVPATSGQSQFTIEDGTGAIQYISNDWLIKASDLMLNGVTYEPQRGDQIIDGDITYRVMLPSATDNPWKWADSITRVLRRIHTKQTEGT